MKNCQEIEIEIEEVRNLLKNKKRLTKKIKIDTNDQLKCNSQNAYDMCANCTCWKSAREYCS